MKLERCSFGRVAGMTTGTYEAKIKINGSPGFCWIGIGNVGFKIKKADAPNSVIRSHYFPEDNSNQGGSDLANGSTAFSLLDNWTIFKIKKTSNTNAEFYINGDLESTINGSFSGGSPYAGGCETGADDLVNGMEIDWVRTID